MDPSGDVKNKVKQPVKRPELLTLLCIFSFIGSGLAGFSNLFIFLTYDNMDQIIGQLQIELPDIDKLLAGGKRFFLAGFILYSISFIGAIGMWKLKKLGFHLYTGSQIFILFLPLVFTPSFPFSFVGLFITIAFISAYAVNLKFMT